MLSIISVVYITIISHRSSNLLTEVCYNTRDAKDFTLL